jgi:NAD-dependent deacetylase
VVFPAAELVHTARRAGAETWLVNLDPAVNTDDFDHFLQGPSGRLLPELLAP